MYAILSRAAKHISGHLTAVAITRGCTVALVVAHLSRYR